MASRLVQTSFSVRDKKVAGGVGDRREQHLMPAFAKAAAAADPTGFALVDPNGEMSWAQVDLALNRCAQALLATGLGPRRRIAVFAENAAEVALAHLGGLLAGCSSVPVNFHLNAAEASYILSDSETEVVFVGPSTAERGVSAARAAGIGHVVGWGCGGADDALRRDITPWEEFLASADDADPPDEITPLPEPAVHFRHHRPAQGH